MKHRVYIIGSGFSSLSAACYLARDGYDVTVFEKNATIGGRARQLLKDGFTFDMGPTWYWMPDVFDRFFADFGAKTNDYYSIEKLSPAYSVYFGQDDFVTIQDNPSDIKKTFESIEPGSGKKLESFLNEAKSNYDIAIGDIVYRPGESAFELVSMKTVGKIDRFFSTVSSDVAKRFKNERLRKILEFPVLFLGAKPSETPSFYTFMNHADFGLGTFYAKGGMFSVVKGIEKLALELGVKFQTHSNVEKITVDADSEVDGIIVNGEKLWAEIVVSGADYHHSEQLLDERLRTYSPKYWESRVFAPSCLLFYVGFDKKIENVEHHTLFFDTDFDVHAQAIYDDPKWPEEPLFYASFPSKTEQDCAPKGCEAAIFLVPLAPGIDDTPELRESCFSKILHRLKKNTGQSLSENILFKESFCVNDFVSDYNSYKGNAYGMANTLMQTAFLRPKLRSRKVGNLYFAGQLTVPGPGVPPALISGKLVAGLIQKKNRHEVAV
ncbi:MAG: phytoene desaturase [Flavobacterium sp.]|uniref:phytoene desaturase family protein n=1 Tax=Flavobacterium sp. TaxID=239 RepID=UPI00120C7893|nr:oleate hydratase [Flavobacterium sp.]RZJ66251.1 MAG: phytoene desaturase [Flavobacterium sp.]